MSDVILSCQDIKKEYQMGRSRLEILKGITLEIKAGEAVCVSGASGAGKSTLLHILGTLDRPTDGKVFFEGKPVTELNDDQMANFRNQEMGFVFQFHHLLKEFTALENVMMPIRIAGGTKKDARSLAEELMVGVGLKDRLHHFPSEMSGGEQQRVAVARALVRRPKVLLADEPTGNLDTANGLRIQELFFRLKSEMGLTLIVVSHDTAFADKFPRNIYLRDGVLQQHH